MGTLAVNPTTTTKLAASPHESLFRLVYQDPHSGKVALPGSLHCLYLGCCASSKGPHFLPRTSP